MAAEDQAAEELRIGTGSLLGDEPVDLSDLLNTVLDRGAVVHGEVTIAVADVDLIRLNIGLLLQAVASAEARVRTGEAPASRSLAGKMGALPHLQAGRAPAPVLDGNNASEGPPAVATPNVSIADHGPARSLNSVAQGLPERINADEAGPESGLARLVLTLIEVLRKVLEHQAVRRMEGGKLSEAEIERLGLALARLNDRMGELKRVFGLTEEDLQIDLGPLGRLK